MQASPRLLLVLMLLVSDEGTWSRGAPMPTERGEVGAAAVDGKIYVVGAYSGVTNANEATTRPPTAGRPWRRCRAA